MAEEGTLGLGRASHESYDDHDEPSKEELQRRMEEARESITQTVTEIKETVTNQYYSMKETVSDALDWRHHFRKNPIAFSVGALGAGFLVGYGLAGAFKGNGQEREDYPSNEESDVFARTGATPQRYEDDMPERHSSFHGHSYAAQPITDGPHETADSGERSSSDQDAEETSSDDRPVKGGSYIYSAAREQPREDNKPGLFERFKETSAYDRLQSEVSSLGDRFIDELSKTAHTVVLPALFNKIKELFGVDLSGKQGQGQQARGQEPAKTSQTNAPSAQGQNAQAASASASLANASRGGASYATSENRGYGGQSSEGAGGSGQNQDNSVLDLDR